MNWIGARLKVVDAVYDSSFLNRIGSDRRDWGRVTLGRRRKECSSKAESSKAESSKAESESLFARRYGSDARWREGWLCRMENRFTKKPQLQQHPRH